MASGDWIDSVYTLAALPAPLDSKNGSISASIVSSLTQGKKRKRSEVAAAIDGEGVNIYSVEDSNLIASYAVPPETFFDAAPCSICCKRNKQTPPRRLTYTASRASKSSKTVRLSCFEAGSQDSGYGAAKPSAQNLPSPAPTTLIDILPTPRITEADAESHQIITLQNDGSLSCFSEKAQKSLWSTQLSNVATASDGFDLPEDFEVVHAELVSLTVASQGILQGRQDVLAVFDAADAASTYILAAVVTSPSIRSRNVLDADVHIYSLRPAASSKATLSRILTQQLLSWNLPQAVKRGPSTTSDFKLASSTGSLTELNDGSVITYDMSGLAPKAIDTFTSRDKPQAVIKLTPSLLLSVSSVKYAIHDSKYGSILSSRPVELPQPLGSKKAPLAIEEVVTPAIQFVSYSKRSGIAIALRGNELTAVQISESVRTSKRQKTGTLLIDSLGKGSLDSRLRSTTLENKRGSKKRKRPATSTSSFFTSAELDALINDGHIDEFEREFAATVNFGLAQRDSSYTSDPGAIKPLSTPQADWNFPSMKKLQHLPASRPQALYALSKMFEPRESETDGNEANKTSRSVTIRMKIYPENIFLWLVHTGQLRTDLIQRALSEYMGFDGQVPQGDLIKALAEFDNDLPLVHYVLMYHPHLHANELVAAVQAIVKSLDNSTLPQPEHKPLMDDEFAKTAATTGALTNGVGGLTNGDLPMTNGHVEDEKTEEDLDSVTDAAMKDIDEMMDQAYETLDKLLPIRGETLRQALTKLNVLPPVSVTQTLRSQLTQHELIFLIHILRVELDQGGWTTRYGDREDSDGAEATEEPSNRAITVISNMLSCAVDAVGMSGWLTASASNPFDSIDETLTLLRGEISNTLEGVHEATFIYGVLSDFLRHHYKRQASELSHSQPRKTNTNMDAEAARKKEQALWKEGKTVVVEKAPPPQLPMGLGLEEQGVKTSVDLYEKRLYGEMRKKRMADVGREIRRGLPQYVFERIRF